MPGGDWVSDVPADGRAADSPRTGLAGARRAEVQAAPVSDNKTLHSPGCGQRRSVLLVHISYTYRSDPGRGVEQAVSFDCVLGWQEGKISFKA